MKPANENIRLIKPFLRGLPIIIAGMALCIALAKRYLKYATPMYESTSKIRLADSKDGSPSANLYKDFDVFANANKIGAELEVLKSRILIDKALDSVAFDITTYRVGQIRKIELYNESPFAVKAMFNDGLLYDKPIALSILSADTISLLIPGILQPIKGSFGQPILIKGDTLLIEKNEAFLQSKTNARLIDKYEFIVHSRQKLIDEVIGNIDITSIDKEIPILRLTYKSPVALKAACFVNRLSQTYIEDYIETKYKSANTTVNFLNKQLANVGGKLSASENAIESYKDQKRIINLRQETETDLRKIADMKVQQTNVKMNLEAIEDLYKYMKSGKDPLELAPNFEAYTDLLATELVKKMKLLQAQRKELTLKYTEEHEQVKVIDAQLKDVTQYLEEGINNSRKNLQVKYERISRDIEYAEQAFIGLPAKEKNLGILSRNFMLNEQTYNFLHEKRTEAQIASAATISFHRILSPGDVPKEPISPNGTLLKILAGFLGFLGSVAAIYIVHTIKGKVNDSITIEKNSSLPVAAETPMLRNGKLKAQHFRKLAIQLEIKQIIKQNAVTVLSSFTSKEGKSFNSWYLAQELSSQSKNILLADADGKMPAKGYNTGTQQFDYINLTDIRFINSNELKAQLEQWKKVYDHVIIKNENIKTASTGLLLMKEADINLFIMDSRRTGAKMVAEADLLNHEYKFNNMQFLLNRAGYNPNILLQGFDLAKWLFKKIAGNKKAL